LHQERRLAPILLQLIRRFLLCHLFDDDLYRSGDRGAEL
jgi:hypothetical protein